MTEHTWIDTAAALVEPLTDWFIKQTQHGHVEEFSPKQLELLEELLKAGMTGMAKIIASHFSSMESRIAKLENENRCLIAESAASLASTAADSDTFASDCLHRPTVLCLDQLIPVEPDTVLRVDLQESVNEDDSNICVDGALDTLAELGPTNDLSLDAIYEEVNWSECVRIEAASDRPSRSSPVGRVFPAAERKCTSLLPLANRYGRCSSSKTTWTKRRKTVTISTGYGNSSEHPILS